MKIKVRNPSGFVIAVLDEESVTIEVEDHCYPGTFPPHPFKIRLRPIQGTDRKTDKVITEHIPPK